MTDNGDPIATHVATIWRDVLGAGADRDDATFFELSGQSIAATRIIARIEDDLGISVDIGDLFEDPDLPAFIAAVRSVAVSTSE
jgi:acyl carrier protein